MVNIQKPAVTGWWATLIHIAYQAMCRWTRYGFFISLFPNRRKSVLSRVSSARLIWFLIEDEIHFLFNSSKYSLIRNNFCNKVEILIPNTTQLPVNVLINELMNTSNYYINLQFMKYISACFDFRGEILTL